MATNLARPQRMTLDEFLAWDDGTETRYELAGGEVVAMTPPLESHGTVVANLGGELRSRLTPPCRVVTEAGIVRADGDDSYYQADLAVTCAPPDPGRGYLAEPVLVVEVLSAFTATQDRAWKLGDYMAITSVREILLVSTRRRHVRLFRRAGEAWLMEELIGEAELRLETAEPPIPLAAIYQGTGLER